MMGSKLRRKISAFLDNKRGSVAILFGISLIPMLIFAGVAIDYGVESRDASQLGAAVDAAALDAISPSSAGYKTALTMTSDGTINVSSTPYVSILNANVGNRPEMSLTSTTVTLTRTWPNVTATVTAKANVATFMMNIMGINSVAIQKTSTASVNLPTYYNFYMLLDNSPSMGVGATPTDITNLQNATNSDTNYLNNVAGQYPCALACHDLSQTGATYWYNGKSYPTDTYTIARNNNVTLRIDLVTAATKNLMTVATNAEAASGITNQFQFAVYTFGTTAQAAQSGISNIVPLSSNLSNVATQAAAIDLMTVTSGGEYNDQDTSFDTALPALSKIMPTPGNGSSTASPQEVLILITDGISDESLSGSRVIQPINTALCTAIKNRGIQIAVLYTTYYPITANGFYNAYVGPYNTGSPTAIETALQKCSSGSTFYNEVGLGGNVAAGLTGLFNNVIATTRLTN